nr:helix-hairpin-helix domain-containing protein [Paenibacillus sp. PL91]
MALEQAGEDSKLDINRATAEELDALKGIGPAKAKAIVQDRDQNGKFNSVDDLLRVKGIGEKLLQGIEESIVARP